MLQPECRATCIGSFPHTGPGPAIRLVLDCFPEIPAWPQLPNLSDYENMITQFSEGLPLTFFDPETNQLRLDNDADAVIATEHFYEKIASGDLAFFALSGDFAAGFFPFIEAVSRRPGKLFGIKGQVTGPVTWAYSVRMNNGFCSWKNENFRDIIIKGLACKAKWQAEQLVQLCDNVIIFADEPMLHVLDKKEDAAPGEAAAALKDLFSRISGPGITTGIHICGSCDWTEIAETGTDVLSFDAFGYGESISGHEESLAGFVERGGCIAWGIVPASDRAEHETPDSLAMRVTGLVRRIAAAGTDESTVLKQSFVTPACGTGNLSVATAETIMRKTSEVSGLLRGIK